MWTMYLFSGLERLECNSITLIKLLPSGTEINAVVMTGLNFE